MKSRQMDSFYFMETELIGHQLWFVRYIIYGNQMGGEESKPEVNEDQFVLEHISKLALENKKEIHYYLMVSAKETKWDTNRDVVELLRQYFKLDIFSQINTLKQEMSFFSIEEVVKIIADDSFGHEAYDYFQKEPKIAEVIVFGHPQKAKQLSSQYNKIKAWSCQTQDLIQKLNKLEKGNKVESAGINMLLLIESDTKLINKYRLNFHCIIHSSERKKAKQDFIRAAYQLYPSQQQKISLFQKIYPVEAQGHLDFYHQVLSWALQDSFYFHLINQIPKYTTDPKKFGYIRLAAKDLYQAIYHCFQANKYSKEMYIIIELSNQQADKLSQSIGNFVIFTSFVKGFSSQVQACQQKKRRPNSYYLIVRSNKGAREQSVNFGYYADLKAKNENIIFNIFNLFRVDSFNLQTREVVLLYGSLSEALYKRKTETLRDKITPQERLLLRNFDYLEDVVEKVDSQAALLQLSGYFKQSLDIYDKKVNQLRKTNDSLESMNRCLIKKGDTLLASGDFNNAKIQYESISSTSEKMLAISLVHLAQLYLQNGQENQLEKTLAELQQRISILENNEIEEYVKGYNIIALSMMKKAQFKKASDILTKLEKIVCKKYGDGLEGKPLVHEIYRNMAICKFKQGQHKEALGQLKSTLEWQLVCEGKSANVAMTQTLIQSVSQSSGAEMELKKSEQRLSSIMNQIQADELRCCFRAITDLQRSIINNNIH